MTRVVEDVYIYLIINSIVFWFDVHNFIVGIYEVG